MDNSNKQNNKQNPNKQNNPNSKQESSKASTQQDELQQGAPNSSSGATVVHSSAWRRLLAKKWAYPALYIAAVAIILTVMWAYQGADKVPLVDGQLGDPALSVSDLTTEGEGLVDDQEHLPAAASMETMNWPVADFNQIEVLVPFFDSEGSNEAQQAATIQYGNTFMASLGMSLSRQDDEPFDVLAALSGTVTHVENHPVLGHIVEITHDDGFKTVYQSLNHVTVQAQQQVEQGDVIAQAGRNELGKDLGVHLHFEVYQDGQPIDPQAFINGS